MRSLLKKIVKAGPDGLADWARWAYDFLPPSFKFGKEYSKALELFLESETWPLSRLRSHQETLLAELISHSYDHVPYYRELFDEHGLKPKDVQTLDDLRKLPFLTKDLVKKNKSKLMAADQGRWRPEPLSTSGTTGSPLDFKIDIATRGMERAQAVRQLIWLGYRKGDRIAELRADPFANPDKTHWFFPASNILNIPMFILNRDRLARIFQTLERYAPDFVRIYPSALKTLAEWMEDHGKTLPSVRYVLTSSELLFPSVRELAERTFQARIIDNYGQNEQCAYAAQCRLGDGYHVLMEQGVFELIPLPGGEHEIVGTSLYNKAMPFIRYRTGDLAEATDKPCSCGRTLPTVSGIKGRVGDLILTPEKNIIMPVSLDYAVYHLEEIREAQFIQEEIDRLKVNVVPCRPMNESLRIKMRKIIAVYLNSPGMKVEIREVDSIPTTEGGKKPFIISRINLKAENIGSASYG